jgi:hypothetical protein
MRALAAALLLVLASAWLGSANETAWVLWDETWIASASSGNHPPPRFEIISGYGTVKECEAARVTWLRERSLLLDPTDSDVLKQGLTNRLEPAVIGYDKIAAWNYARPVCLPASIDPRGPAR